MNRRHCGTGFLILIIFLVPPAALAAVLDCPAGAIDAPPPAASSIPSSDASAAKPLVIGTHIGLSTSASDWERVAETNDAWIWRLAVRSEGAAFLRPHFEGGPSGWADVYGIAGIIHRIFLEEEIPAWGPIVDGEMLFVEISTPDASPPEISLDKVSRGAIDFFRIEKESYCYLDVTCYDEWRDLATAVGRMEFESGEQSLLCTGSLLGDLPHTARPFFLSANHCVKRQSEAETLIVFWNYVTDVCDGAPPSVETVPQTNGADFLVGNETSDYSLMMLHEDPPAGTAFLEFTTGDAPLNEPITVIHHPGGTYKRISFGNVADVSGDFWTVVYTESSTEGGSSGSPLFNSAKQVIGQLSAGLAACWDMEETDIYGKFSVSWADGLAPYLSNSTLPTTTTTTTTIPIDLDDTEDDWSPRSPSNVDHRFCGC